MAMVNLKLRQMKQQAIIEEDKRKVYARIDELEEEKAASEDWQNLVNLREQVAQLQKQRTEQHNEFENQITQLRDHINSTAAWTVTAQQEIARLEVMNRKVKLEAATKETSFKLSIWKQREYVQAVKKQAALDAESMRVEIQAAKSIVKSCKGGKRSSIGAITQTQMAGFVKSMQRAQNAKETEAKGEKAAGIEIETDTDTDTETKTKTTKATETVPESEASKVVDNTMDLMALVAEDEQQATSMADNGGIEEIVKVLDSSESTPKQKKKAATVLNNVAKHNNLGLSAKMVDLQVSAIIAAALRDTEDDDFAEDALTLLMNLTSTCGAEECGLDIGSLKIISVAVENQASRGENNEKGKELLNSMSSIYKAEGSDAIDDKMKMAAQELSIIETIAEVKDASGKTYYVNRATNETSWEAPTVYTAACQKFENVADLGETHAKNMKEVDTTTISQSVAALEAMMTTNPTAAVSITGALSRLVTHEKNAKVIADSGGISTIMNAMRKNPTVKQLLINCTRLLNQFAKHDFYKTIVASEGGIPLIIFYLTNKLDEEILVTMCLSCIANLALSSSVNLNAILTAGGISAVENVMQKYVDTAPILELTMVLLSNFKTTMELAPSPAPSPAPTPAPSPTPSSLEETLESLRGASPSSQNGTPPGRRSAPTPTLVSVTTPPSSTDFTPPPSTKEALPQRRATQLPKSKSDYANVQIDETTKQRSNVDDAYVFRNSIVKKHRKQEKKNRFGQRKQEGVGKSARFSSISISNEQLTQLKSDNDQLKAARSSESQDLSTMLYPATDALNVSKEDNITIMKDTNGRRYSYNKTTGETVWLDALDAVKVLADAASGRRYSYNNNTKETMWLAKD